LSKIKKVADQALSKSQFVMLWDKTGSSSTYFKTFELCHETKLEMVKVWDKEMEKEKMLQDMRDLVVKGMKTGKMVAFNMCRSATNFYG